MAKCRRAFTVKHRVRLHRVEQLEDRCLMAGDVVDAPWSLMLNNLQHGAPGIRIPLPDWAPPTVGNLGAGEGHEVGGLPPPVQVLPPPISNVPPPAISPPQTAVPTPEESPPANPAGNVSVGLPAVFGAGGFAQGNIVATDSAGNVYMSGRFSGTVDFDPGPGLDLHDSGAGIGEFVIKLTSQGNLAWARSFREMGAGLDMPDFSGLAVDSNSGRVYLSGTRFPDDHHVNVRLVALDANGEQLWTEELTGSYFTDSTPKLAIDRSGNLLVAGAYCGKMDLDPGSGEWLVSAAGNDSLPVFGAFVAKYTPSGELIWGANLAAPEDTIEQSDLHNALAYDLVLDGADNVYVTGHFNSTIDVDPGSSTEILAGGGTFVTKLDADGHLVWGKALGPGSGQAIAVDVSGNVFLASENYSLRPAFGYTGTFDGLISKLDANGNVLWQRVLDDSSNGLWWTLGDIAVGSEGDLYVTGSNLYLARLSSAGDLLWSHVQTSPLFARGSGIAIDLEGHIYVTGSFVGAADLDPGPQSLLFTSPTAPAPGKSWAYLLKLDSSGNLVIVQAAPVAAEPIESASGEQTNLLGVVLSSASADTATLAFPDLTSPDDLVAPPSESSHDADDSMPVSTPTETSAAAPPSAVWDRIDDWLELNDELASLADLSDQNVSLPIEA